MLTLTKANFFSPVQRKPDFCHLVSILPIPANFKSPNCPSWKPVNQINMNSVLDFIGFFLYLVYRIVMIPIVAVLYLFLAAAYFYNWVFNTLYYSRKVIAEVRLFYYFTKQVLHFKGKTVVRSLSH